MDTFACNRNMKTMVRVADEGSQVELARDKYWVRYGCVNCRGSDSVLAPPQKPNTVQVDTMAALFYRVTLCALALFSLEVKGRQLA